MKYDECYMNHENIAKKAGIEPMSLLKLIKIHLVELEKLGDVRYIKFKAYTRGNPQHIYLLNKKQTMYLVFIIKNNEKALKWKFEIAQTFEELMVGKNDQNLAGKALGVDLVKVVEG